MAHGADRGHNCLSRIQQWWHDTFGGKAGSVKILVGLGNPGHKYKGTRHNVGFRVVELVAERLGASFSREKYHGLIAEAQRAGENVLLIKPQTFMNNSGVCVSQAVRYKNAERQDVLVVVDDVNLALGKLRIRGSGSAGGHNGLKSIIAHLGTEEFARLRVGVGLNRGSGDLSGHVLGSFTPDEKIEMDVVVPRAADAILAFIDGGIEDAMSRFNG